jgi:SAM-dependent methyltransferase
LMEDGWGPITCTDLGEFGALEDTRRLFPGLRFEQLDILAGPAPERYGAAMALSLIHLFDAEAFDRFLANVNASLRPGGTFVLDSAGAPDNQSTRFLHDALLRYETRLKALVKTVVTRKRHGFVIQEFGWFRTDADIVDAAARAGFVLKDAGRFAFEFEFSRSAVTGRMLRLPGFRGVFALLGRGMPYVRMFELEKVRDLAGAATEAPA